MFKPMCLLGHSWAVVAMPLRWNSYEQCKRCGKRRPWDGALDEDPEQRQAGEPVSEDIVGTCRDCGGSLPTPFVYCPSGSLGSPCRPTPEGVH